jgi:hypothetical protein
LKEEDEEERKKINNLVCETKKQRFLIIATRKSEQAIWQQWYLWYSLAVIFTLQDWDYSNGGGCKLNG